MDSKLSQFALTHRPNYLASPPKQTHPNRARSDKPHSVPSKFGAARSRPAWGGWVDYLEMHEPAEQSAVHTQRRLDESQLQALGMQPLWEVKTQRRPVPQSSSPLHPCGLGPGHKRFSAPHAAMSTNTANAVRAKGRLTPFPRARPVPRRRAWKSHPQVGAPVSFLTQGSSVIRRHGLIPSNTARH